MNTARIFGIILIVLGFGLAAVGGLYLATQASGGDLESGGAILGGGILFVFITALVGFGIFLFVRGGQEEEQESVMQKQRQLLDIVKSRGQVGVNELALEMSTSVDDIKSMVHQLVGLQVFSGYINWKDGTLYSAEAKKLTELKNCENCGAPIELAGKGVVACKFCGTEYFLT